MRVVCPYEPEVHELTRASLDLHIPAPVEYIRVGPLHDGYWRLLCQLWAAQRPFVLIEHDMEIHERVYPAFRHCPEPWCAFPYPCGSFVPDAGTDPLTYVALGCVRFRRRLMLEHPTLVATLGLGEGTPQHMVDQARDWRGLDAHVTSQLQRVLNHGPHIHWPAVTHHHDYPRGCACGVISHEKVSA